MNYSETPEFKKDVKMLKKRVPTLVSDLDRIKARIDSLYVLGDDMTEAELTEYRKQFFSGKVAAVLPESSVEHEIIKVRLDSDTSQYRNKLRLIFIVIRNKDNIILVELYSKNDKNREDAKRIKKYCIDFKN